MYRRIKIDITSAHVPIVMYTLGDRSEHWAIIDTGAQYSIMDKSLGGGVEDGREMNMVTLSSDRGQVAHRADKCIVFTDTNDNKFKCDIVGFEMELKHIEDAVKLKSRNKIKIDMIIGNFDLRVYQCKIDLKNGYLWIRDKKK